MDDYDKSSGGGHAVAWGFLRLSGYKLPITRPRVMQLQLYEYSTGAQMQLDVQSACSAVSRINFRT